MTLLPDSTPSSNDLLERARLTLQAIQYRERASRYKAAAATLQAAMVHAENGNTTKLKEWMESESPQFESDPDWCDSTDGVMELPSHHRERVRSDPPRVDRFDPPVSNTPHDKSVRGVTSEVVSEELPASPWDRIEKAATARNKARIGNPEEQGERAAWHFKVPATSDNNDVLEPLAKVCSTPDEVPVPEELIAAIEGTIRNDDDVFALRWWKAPHVWISLLVHVGLLVCLMFVVVTIASEPKILSIVSASVESENVLMETPMEMESELESVAEPMQSAPMPAISEFQAEVAIHEVSLQSGEITSPQPSVTSAVSSAVADAAQSASVGSKSITGAEFFGVKAVGNTFVYIVDSSPSMRRDGAFEAARSEILRSLSSMKPKQRYFVSFFGKEIDAMIFEHGVVERYPVYAKPENLTKTIEWLSQVQVQKDGLPPNNALTEAIAMQPDGIFLLFDGDTKVDVAKHLRRVNRSDDIINAGEPKIPIHVVHFFQEEFQKQMKQIADENKGTYRFVSRPERPNKGSRK